MRSNFCQTNLSDPKLNWLLNLGYKLHNLAYILKLNWLEHIVYIVYILIYTYHRAFQPFYYIHNIYSICIIIIIIFVIIIITIASPIYIIQSHVFIFLFPHSFF